MPEENSTRGLGKPGINQVTFQAVNGQPSHFEPRLHGSEAASPLGLCVHAENSRLRGAPRPARQTNRGLELHFHLPCTDSLTRCVFAPPCAGGARTAPIGSCSPSLSCQGFKWTQREKKGGGKGHAIACTAEQIVWAKEQLKVYRTTHAQFTSSRLEFT